MNRHISCWVLYAYILSFALNTHALSAAKTVRLISDPTIFAIDADSQQVWSIYQKSYTEIYEKNDLVKAQIYIDSGLQLAKTISFPDGIITAQYYQGLVEMQMGNYDSAMTHLNNYRNYFTIRGDSAKVGTALYVMANIHSFQGEDEQKLNLLIRSLRIAESIPDSMAMARSFNGIGIVYRKLGKLDEAKAATRNAAKIYKHRGKSKAYSMSLQNIANILTSQNKYDSALYQYEEALKIIEPLQSKLEEAYILGNIGYLYGELDQNIKALEYKTRALKIWKTLPNKKDYADMLDNVGNSYYKLKDYSQAITYFKESLEIAQELNLKELIAEVNHELSDVYFEMNVFEKAFSHQKVSQQWKDSIYNEENSKIINELQTKYETEIKERQIAQLAMDKEKQENEIERQSFLKLIFMSGFVLLAVVLLLIFFMLRQRLRNHKMLAAKNEEVKEAIYKSQVTELAKKALQAQINPHFIFNCMNSINQMIMDGDNDHASKYLTKFGRLIRLILENAEDTEVVLKDELTMLEMYIQMEMLRFGGAIDYTINVEDDVDVENTYLPSMVLQPFVENAIWHGLMPKKDAAIGRIAITIKQRNGQLICEIEDNGIGREKALELQQKTVYKSKSLGLKITEERLRLLSREMQRQWIKFIDLKDPIGYAIGTRVEVSIPIS